MAITASAKSGFEPVSEGVHMATCISIIDLGDQWSEQYKKNSHKVMLTWEIPDEMVEINGEEAPRFISKEYTLSLAEKATLRNHLEAWRGKKFNSQELMGFDLRNVLGKSCQLQILHTDNGYANISSVMSIPKGMATPEIHAKLTYFDLTDPNCLNLMDDLPGWVQDKVKKSPDYQELVDRRVDSSPEFSELDDEEGGILPF